ncbi:MAG: hypothetical protein E7Z91_06050 [Cyanobacteria bacterium SIG30]|nr:hypothetical protein [Cyanobacteria bacterium SIG30]
MAQRLNGTGLFTQLISGINNSYSLALQNTDKDAKGISLNNIMSSLNSTNLSNPLYFAQSNNFSSYLSTNFKGIDQDKDGVISNNELTNFTNNLYQTGLTQEQLALLCNYGTASSTLEEVLNNFNEIDKNHDGRVTQAEISAYGIDEEVSEKQKEFMDLKPKRMSLFYSGSTSSSDSIEN